LNARLGDYLAKPLPLHPWLYPPHYLLLLLPFGLLPFAPAGVLFVGLSLAGAVAACWRFARGKKERIVYLCSLLLCPASAITVCIGQNTFLTCALLVSGFGFAKQRPVLGGMLLGLLTYKPQLWLMVPVALIADRQWKALASAFATAAALMALSVAVFGLQPWRDWIEIMTAPSALYDQWRVIARLNGQSVYTYATLMGASEPLANLAQAASALFAAACVWRCYRRPMTEDLRLAALLAATMLAAPHVIDYDAVLLGIAATLFFLRASSDGLRFGDTALAALIWASPLMNPPSVFRIGLATPFLIATFLAWVMARGKRAGVEALPRGIPSAV
jgi:hypothetical protein